MVLYKAKIVKSEIKLIEFNVLYESDNYYSINLLTVSGKYKKVSKKAKKPFASASKKQAVKVLCEKLEYLKTQARFHPQWYRYDNNKHIQACKTLIQTL
jgi:hypothetical protein